MEKQKGFILYCSLFISFCLLSCTDIAGEGDLLRVAVSVEPENSSGLQVSESQTRALTPAIVKGAVNYYEVVFKDSDNRCYVGTGDMNDVLTVGVPAGQGFQVLLLAGSKQKEGVFVLLASSYKDNVEIKQGVENKITLPKFIQIAFNPLTDYKVECNDVFSVAAVPPVPNTYGVPVVDIPKKTDLSWSVTGTGSGARAFLVEAALVMENLITAQKAVSPTATPATLFNKKALSIVAISAETFTAISLETADVTAGADPNKNVTLTFSVPNSKIPNLDSTGRMVFELGYSAFSLGDSKLMKWRIRPGLNYALDRNSTAHKGGAIAVKVGGGGTVDYGSNISVEIPIPSL